MTKSTRTTLAVLLALALGACVSAPEQRPEALVQGERFLELGVQAYGADDYANAAAHFTKALAHYQGLDHRRGIVQSRINLAETALAAGNFPAARQHLGAAENIARQEDWPEMLRRVHLLQSTVALKVGAYDETDRLLEALLQGKADEIQSSALANRAALALARNDADAADWVARFAAVGNSQPLLSARRLRFEAELRNRGGEPDAAAALLQQALAIYKEVPVRAGTAAALEEWGMLLARQQQWDAAEDKLLRALDVRLWLLDRADTAADLRRLADINIQAGRAQRAASLSRWADIVAGSEPINWSALKREVLPY